MLCSSQRCSKSSTHPYWSTTSNNTVSDDAIGVPLLMTAVERFGSNSSARLARYGFERSSSTGTRECSGSAT